MLANNNTYCTRDLVKESSGAEDKDASETRDCGFRHLDGPDPYAKAFDKSCASTKKSDDMPIEISDGDPGTEEQCST
ncbi:hypothetical protein VNO77_03747 [Canavalia gladiata]|uniref:Uncharacterized protein n=1 Tax=Canavalia gladiata TaxID=3824 RepID=A0AAN9N1Q1_CANGL